MFEKLKIEKRFTETPDAEQWQLLSRFEYPANARKYLEEKGISPISDSVLEAISGSFIQAKEYFNASQSVSLYTAPVLLYYGTINLLNGLFSLNTGKMIEIRNHGVKCKVSDSNKPVADSQIKTLGSNDGAFRSFLSLFVDISSFPFGETWSLYEIFGSIPEVRTAFRATFERKHAFSVVPIQFVKEEKRSFDRILAEEFPKHDIEDHLSRILEYDSCYIAPQITQDGKKVVLRRKLIGKEIGIISVYGEKYFHLSHEKNGQKVSMPQMIYHFLGLYCLGFIARYCPDKWGTFIKNDSSGELHFIDTFLRSSGRCVPNLSLNFLYGTNFVFTQTQPGPIILPKS